MGKNQNTFAKMQREREKKRKAEEKRQKRLLRKAGVVNEESGSDQPDGEGQEAVEGAADTLEETDSDNSSEA